MKTIIFPHLIEKIAFSSVEFNVLSMTKKPTSSDKCFHRLIVLGLHIFCDKIFVVYYSVVDCFDVFVVCKFFLQFSLSKS